MPYCSQSKITVLPSYTKTRWMRCQRTARDITWGQARLIETNRPQIDRAVQIAEMLDTPSVRQLLEEWSKGGGILNLKDAATQACERLGLVK
jgi:hypothetical protein